MASSSTTLYHSLVLFFFSVFFLLLLHSLPSSAQTSRNLTLGDSLSALDDDKPALWALSPSGDFAFGFLPLKANGTAAARFLLAIWFAKINTEQTVVWSANRNNPVQKGSSVELMTTGLVLKDQTGQQIWKGDPGSVSYASMLDSGNLVLGTTGSSDYRWQSFDNPTDTILPTQVMNKGGLLSSRKSETNYSIGRFQLRLLPDGNLVLNTIALPTDHAYEAYWISVGTLESGSQVVFNQSGIVQITRTNASVVNVTNDGNVGSTTDYYQRATLDPDGVFRHYVHPKPGAGKESRSWTESSSIPEDKDMCAAVVVVKEGGSGACGFNSYCSLVGGRPSCECPVRYTYVDPTDTRMGCIPDFDGPSCLRSDELGLFDMKDMPNINWPWTDYELLTPMNEDECRNACLGDCLCWVAIFSGGNCWKKKIPLSNGRIEPGIGGKALIKVPKDNISTSLPPQQQLPLLPPGSDGGKKAQPIGVSVALGGSVFVNFLLLSAIALAYFSSNCRKLQRRTPPDLRMVGPNIRSFSYKLLEEATGRFKEELGKGAFGTVYKGVLELDSRTFIAVKRLDKVLQEGEKEFRTEMKAIGRTHHRNLVQLLGFCDEGQHRLLVYEFMSNGSLANYLFASNKPSWEQRMQIALGIARGLSYLHEECNTQIIHCDIKPQNILLDDSFTARISDFGLAKLLMSDQTRTTTGIRGTRGYVATEWIKNMAITAKVDVYSFGVMLLEIICCRKNVQLTLGDEGKEILTDWAYDCYTEERLNMLVDNDEEAMSDRSRLERTVMVALWCIQEESSLRPSMKKVTQMLEGEIKILAPPQPYPISSIY